MTLRTDLGDLQRGRVGKGRVPTLPSAPLFGWAENDYVWTQFIDGQILPVGMKK